MLRHLNSVQRQAVEKINGPNLILAGAGSGKTRVLTHKIAYLIQRKKVKPESILAMTFTNKAANEMKDRVEALLNQPVKGLWIGTFHSLFARILRKNCEKLGYHPNFVIYDEVDQLALIKSILSDLNIPASASIESKTIHSKIKYLKNSNLSPEQVKLFNTSSFDDVFYHILITYQTRLQQNNAMDFEDLLLRSIDLFKLFPRVLEFYQHQFQYILVDEYQDTNRLQYELIKLLGQKHKNISVVGDDDQSIYRWRGAEIRNILDFERDYPDCAIFRLEQNYRSTGNILQVAQAIISQNRTRMGKELWTKKESGEKCIFVLTDDAHDEAMKIVQKIEAEIREHELNFSDFAILYRTNAQSRALEEVLKNKGINYVIVAGIRFYDRKEIKDVLAYLKVLTNPGDSVSIKRIINYPARGIGEATIKKIEEFCRQNHITLFQGLAKIEDIEAISPKTKNNITQFYQLFDKYIKLRGSLPVSELIAALIEEIGILTILKQEDSFESLNKIDNIRELMSGINEFILEHPSLSLENYLENVSLITDIDNWDSKANAVSLLTLHSAKGLEFSVVFITGLEEGLFPLARHMNNNDELEEERRLFYVGATRAKEKLYLFAALNRMKYGESSNGAISRFVTEIDRDLLEIDEMMFSGPSLKVLPARVQPTPINPYRHDQLKIAQRPPKEIKPGILVKHPTFGKGVVRSVQGAAENLKLNIIFEEVGEKKIILKYSKLEIL